MNDVYWERNQLVLALTKLYKSWSSIEPQEPEWLIIFIELPTGQVSWHVPKAEYDQYFSHLPVEPNVWDGHTTEEKYDRLRALTNV